MITKQETINSNKLFLEEIKAYKNISDRYFKDMLTTINQYSLFHNETIETLLLEAETDEEKGILLRKRQIKHRLLDYLVYLQNNNYANSSIQTKINHLKSVYNFYEIQLPKLPTIQVKNTENINDIPTNNDIKKALTYSSTKMKAIITFMASSGTARNETANITIQQFINATKEYHNNKQNILEVIQTIEHCNDIIPIFELTRFKTNYPYYTFCSTESTKFIIQMLKERLMKKDISNDDKLFDLSADSITKNYRRLNNKCGFGYKNDKVFFHSHAMRKFFVSQMYNEGLDYLTIEFMIGHSISKVQEAYFKANPLKQRVKYMRFVDKVTFLDKVQYVDINSKEKRELEELKEYKMKSEQEIKQLRSMIDYINSQI